MRPPRLAPLLSLLAGTSAAAFDGTFLPIEGGTWDVDNGPIEYVLEPNGSEDIDDGSDLDAIRSAFRAWECVEGTKLRFVEGQGPGPAAIDDDGKNTLFWDETGEYDLPEAVLGVTLGDASPGSPRASADIVFNGSHTWSVGGSGVDVQSIALHEIGHFIGLDHPCDTSSGAEENCNPASRTVMAPEWSGELDRAPRADDEEGVRALYPAGADDKSGCDGPFRKGERCSCDGECIDGLVCAAVGSGQRVCAERCASDDSDCGSGFACVLDPPEGEEAAAGVCIPIEATGAPAGAICANGNQCASGTCALLFDVARSLCQQACTSDGDCGGGRCTEGFCLGLVRHEECAEPEPPGCGCSTAGDASPPDGGGVLALAILGILGLLSPREARG